MFKEKIFLLFAILFCSKIGAQIFTQADPFYLLELENKSFTVDQDQSKNSLIRPKPRVQLEISE